MYEKEQERRTETVARLIEAVNKVNVLQNIVVMKENEITPLVSFVLREKESSQLPATWLLPQAVVAFKSGSSPRTQTILTLLSAWQLNFSSTLGTCLIWLV